MGWTHVQLDAQMHSFPLALAQEAGKVFWLKAGRLVSLLLYMAKQWTRGRPHAVTRQPSMATPEEAVDKVCVMLPLKKFMLNSGTIISTKVAYRNTLGASMYMPVP